MHRNICAQSIRMVVSVHYSKLEPASVRTCFASIMSGGMQLLMLNACASR